ncbi:hypothetical protein M413DRAFT_326653 [Hebeloma cylindrosporum]|uniref:Uncharacterized protein n=1 Tax=Hebeloma cylindrosporum TaxID=76867 RepID=A0A0C2XCP1_HEBCY|nr:hypothetical protein M413DRAFT_326653 [Hebeloma cylindrosporum h7]
MCARAVKLDIGILSHQSRTSTLVVFRAWAVFNETRRSLSQAVGPHFQEACGEAAAAVSHNRIYHEIAR